ncbi:hypothetical protein [Deinococcus sonorensis]|uniref:2-isopropylmalate synthase/homocitrate synthase post-catalytic domain-containing protein n=2 Tax=Deinococcus sonorensis TaxID=309891 RepID=A0AAU7U7G8_9DEIO
MGDHAFAHETGIRQDGVLNHKETCEIMNAKQRGREAGVLVIGKHSGRVDFRKALTDLASDLDGHRHHRLNEEAMNAALRALQSAGQPQGAALRRRPARPWGRRLRPECSA